MLSSRAVSVSYNTNLGLAARGGRSVFRISEGQERRYNSQKFSAVVNDQYGQKPSVSHRLHKTSHVCAAIENRYVPETKAYRSDSLWASVCKQLHAFHRFSRPHTIIGTIIGVTSVSLLPVESIAEISPKIFMGWLKALLAAVFMNIYVVGLNQLFDVEIDKINKPWLPVASGEFSFITGIALIAAFAIMSFTIGMKSQSPPLLCALLICFFLGSAYSVNLPLLRWKRHAFLAAFCILCVRAIVLPLAFFVHMQRYVLGRPMVLSKSVVFATAFTCFFSTVIALFKDIPDVDGDRYFGIQSFSVCLGQEKVFWLCVNLLLGAYVGAMLVGASQSNVYRRLVTVLGHGFLASFLLFGARSINIQNKASVTSFYMFIWKVCIHAVSGSSAFSYQVLISS